LDFKFYGFLRLFGDRHEWISFYLEYWDAAIMDGVFSIVDGFIRLFHKSL
jgi:hypothetical protein